MRAFTSLAAFGAILLAAGGVAAADKPQAPKARKVCTVIEPAVGRIPEKRICRTVPAPVPAAQTEAAAPAAAPAGPAQAQPASGN